MQLFKHWYISLRILAIDINNLDERIENLFIKQCCKKWQIDQMMSITTSGVLPERKYGIW